jgi:uncharacterized protein YjgD (DUF1641 family)
MITETASVEQLQEQMDRLEAKLDRVLQYTQDLEHRVEGLSEFKEDVVPILNDAGKLASHKLMQLEASGTLGAVREIVAVLTDRGTLEMASRAANALAAAREEDRKVGLFKAMRDSDVRRGMAVMMAVLGELGAKNSNSNETSQALVAGDSAK